MADTLDFTGPVGGAAPVRPASAPAPAPSRFASRSVPIHILRGVAGALLATAAIWLLSVPGLLAGVMAVVAFVGVVVLLRGCPTCWLIGLFETVAHSARRFRARD